MKILSTLKLNKLHSFLHRHQIVKNFDIDTFNVDIYLV